MKLKLSYLLATVMISTAAVAQAQENKPERPERPSREEMREKFRNMTPEERQQQIKEWREKQGTGGPQFDRRREAMESATKQLGLNPEELRDLKPEERRDKINEAVNKKIAELKKKQTAKTITAEEEKFLERLEARQKFAERFKDGPPRKDGPPAGDRPGPKAHGKKDGEKPGKKEDKTDKE